MIKFGMKLPEIFAQLVRGYRKVTGRDPEGLDLIKIRQESMRRFEEMNKVVDMQGRSIDTSKGIMGGVEVGQKGIFDNIFNDSIPDISLPPPAPRPIASLCCSIVGKITSLFGFSPKPKGLPPSLRPVLDAFSFGPSSPDKTPEVFS